MVETIRENEQPIAQALIRVFHRSDQQSIFIKEYRTNQQGRSERIALDVFDNNASTDIHSEVRPYSQYDVHISKDGFDTEIRNGIQIFADTDSTLQVIMQNHIGKPQINTLTIPEHQLYEGGGCRSC